MALEDYVAILGLAGMLAYSLLGGADFGGGIWDLFATGPRRDEQRSAIARAMGPVWEANHVWLIFVMVLLFTAFPVAFSAASIGLFGLLHGLLLGITLRGAAFVFRGPKVTGEGTNRWGILFGISSTITPVFLGMALGGISSGNLRVVDGRVHVPGATPGLAPVSLVMGVLALTLCAQLAAVYLTKETTGPLQEDFRLRALWAEAAAVCLALLALPLLRLEAPHLWSGLMGGRACGIAIAAGVAATLSVWALWRRRFGLARIATAAEVALLLLGWGVAQYPYLIYPDLTIHNTAGPEPTLRFVLYSFPIGMAFLIPSLWLLLHVFKGIRLLPK